MAVSLVDGDEAKHSAAFLKEGAMGNARRGKKTGRGRPADWLGGFTPREKDA